MTTLEYYRSIIDRYDTEIAYKLMNRRLMSQLCREIKQQIGLPGTDISRENEILARYKDLLGDEAGNIIGHAILDHSKKE